MWIHVIIQYSVELLMRDGRCCQYKKAAVNALQNKKFFSIHSDNSTRTHTYKTKKEKEDSKLTNSFSLPRFRLFLISINIRLIRVYTLNHPTTIPTSTSSRAPFSVLIPTVVVIVV